MGGKTAVRISFHSLFLYKYPALKKFLRSALLISVGGALPLIAGVVLLIPYTENLQTSVYGELAIYISFSLLVQYLMNFGIDTYLSVHYYDYKEDPAGLKKFLSGITGMICLLGSMLILFFSASGYFLFRWIFNDSAIQFFPYGLMSVLTAFFNAFFRTYVNLQVFGEKPMKYFLFGLFNFVVTVIISAVLVYAYPQSLIGPMWGRLLSGVLIFILSLVFILREFGISFDRSMIRPVVKYCTPMLIFNLLTWVLTYINNYILNAYSTSADVGVYDFGLKATLLIEYACVGLLGTINPRVYQLWKKSGLNESTPEENRYHHVFSSFIMVFVAANIVLLPFVIRLFVHTEGYYESIPLIPLLCLGFVFRGLYNMFSNPIFYFKQTKVLPRVLLFSSIIQIGAGILLVQWMGIWGAVWSYFLIRPVQVFFIWLESRKVFQFQFNVFKMLIVPAGYAAIVIALYQFSDLNELYNGLIQLMVAVVLAAILYRKELSGFGKLVFKRPPSNA